MPQGQVLEFAHVTKRFNDVTAVSDFSARIEPGVVTAFLGPNGAGKTTTLRILLGQVRATSGTATIGGIAYPDLRHPLKTIGSVLEETVYRPRRSASRQLTIAAKANGIPLSRVGEVLSLVGLENEADGRIGSFSLGMRQRLSVAHALLGDPGALVFDEPANGLDPEGIRWMRLLMRRLADEGRTVLVSSHVLSEVEQVADHVLVLSKGELVLSRGIETLADPTAGSVVVDAVDRDALRAAIVDAGFELEVLRSGLTVRGGDTGTVGAIAASAGIALTTLVQRGPTLEDIFIDLVRGGRFDPRPLSAPAVLLAEPSPDVDEAASSDEGAAEEDSSEKGVPEDGASDDDAAEDAGAVAASPASVSAVEEAAEAVASPAAADDTAADATVVIDTVQDPDSGQETDSDGVDAPAAEPTFDDILFGNGVTADDDAASSFGDSSPNEGSSAGGEGPDADQSDTDHSGVEVFADLGESSAADHAETSDTSTEIVPDPRAAAVSTMLRAAARAYYEDEPRDYPGASRTADEAAEENRRHWSVASTGVIEVVPNSDQDADVDQDAQPDEGAQPENDGHVEQDGDHEHHDHEHHHG